MPSWVLVTIVGGISSSGNPLHDALRSCVVRIQCEDGTLVGTGVFVAIGQILTCAHVAVAAGAVVSGAQVSVVYGDAVHVGTVQAIVPPPPGSASIPNPYPWPDLAWISVPISDNKCIEFDVEPPKLGLSADEVWASGFAMLFDSRHATLTPATYRVEGPIGTSSDGIRWQLKDAQAAPGMSGSPLLNQRTGKVLGLLTRTRSKDTDLGGWAVQTWDALISIPELGELLELHHSCHERDRSWNEARRAAGLLPEQRRKLVVGWASDSERETVRDVLAEALQEVERAWPPPGGAALQLEYVVGGLGEPTLGTSLIVARAEVVVLISDTLASSPACMDLGRAAASGGTPVVVMSNGPASTHTSIALLELNDLSEVGCDFVDFSGAGIQKVLRELVLKYAFLADRQAFTRGASGLRNMAYNTMRPK